MNRQLFNELNKWLEDNNFIMSKGGDIATIARLDNDNKIITINASVNYLNVRIVINNIIVEFIDIEIESIHDLVRIIEQIEYVINHSLKKIK